MATKAKKTKAKPAQVKSVKSKKAKPAKAKPAKSKAAKVAKPKGKSTAAGKNAALVRRGYAAFNAADIDTLAKLFDESASWHTPGRSSIAGNRKGHEAIFTQFGRYGGETGGTFKADLLDVMESDTGRVVAIHRNTAMRNGKPLDVVCCIVFDLKDGRVVAGKEHFYDLHAWDQFWS